MREVLFRVMALFARRGIRRWWVALATAGAALTWLPLLSMPGYEWSTGMSLLLGLPGLGLATHAARTVERSVTSTCAIAALLFSAALPSLTVAVLRTRFGSACDPFINVQFVPVLLVPTALVTAALGAWVASVTSRWWTALLANLGVVLVSAVHTAWPIVFGPQVYAYNHLGGFMPGPLYDEDLSVTPALLWFRLGTVLLAVALSSRGVLRVAAAVSLLALELQGVALGFRMNDEALAAALGGRVETDELVLFYPRGFDDERVSRILGDLRFRHHQNVEFFGAAPPGKVHVWWYASTADKQRLVGAANTQFAKPWRREVHVNELGFPHPVIKHELVHAMAAPWGAPPFGVAAGLFGLAPHVGVIEGLAVAADDPVDELTLHEWAAAMKKKGLLPDVAAMMTPQGFYGAPPSRAYTTAGSFLRYLADTHGRDKLRALYRDGDFEAAYGTSLTALVADYQAFLDTVPLEPAAVNQAFARFRRGSLFDRPCAREVGRLAGDARAALRDEPDGALALFSRCRALQPEEPSHVLAEAGALRRLSRPDAAATLLDAELKRLADEPSPWAEAALTRADLAVEMNDTALALKLWAGVIERDVSPAVDRTARVRASGADLAAVQRFFTADDEALKLLALRDAGDTLPVRYLLGRKLQQLGASAEALPYLEAVLTMAPPPTLERETRRLAIEAAFALGRCDTVTTLATEPRHRDWVARCAFAFP